MSWMKLAMALIAGLALFLYGMSNMEEGFRAVAGDRLKGIIRRFTRNRFAGVATGALVTAVVDSSSLTTVTVVGLVSAGLMEFASSLAVIMGANVGTTLSSQVIAYDVTSYFPLLLAVGLGLRFAGRNELLKNWGLAVLGLGLVFFGLEYMGEAVKPLKDEPWFTGLAARLENPLYGILVGAAMTALIMSSSAMMGIVISLAGHGAISLPAGIALMMGAELGTCVDTLLSTVGRTRPAVRAGVFQLLFNVLNVLLVVGFTGALARLATMITPGSGPAAIAHQIAHAHVMFNVGGVLALIWFTPQFARLLERLIPDSPRDRAAEPERFRTAVRSP